MTPEELSARHPRLYHATDPANLEGILRYGLLSTSRILSLHGWSEAEHDAFVRSRRSESQVLQHQDLGQAVITDNSPLLEGPLARCLDDGLTPADWCVKLNERAFFFVSASDLNGLLHASATRQRDRLVLVLNTLGVATAYADHMELSPINSGNSRRAAARRGQATFTPLLRHSYEQWRRLRMEHGDKTSLDSIKEVTVVGGIDHVTSYLERHYVVPGGR